MATGGHHLGRGGSDADPIQFDGPVSPRDQDRQILLPDAAGKAWRNAMVAAINAGLEQGIFGLKPGENFWPNAKNGYPDDVKPGGAIFRFTFGGDVPAIVWSAMPGTMNYRCMSRCGRRRTPKSGWCAGTPGARRAASSPPAGWSANVRHTSRRRQPDHRKREGLAAAAEAEVEPVRAAYRDHGRMIF